MHPLSRSPAYVEDEGPVFESAALCLHLADRHPEAGLIGELGSHERALQYQWCFFAMTELEAPLIDDRARAVEGLGRARRCRAWRTGASASRLGTDVLEAALDGGDYLVGDRFSVADVVVGGVLTFARMAEITELSPGIVPYVDDLEARPARQRAYTRTA